MKLYRRLAVSLTSLIILFAFQSQSFAENDWKTVYGNLLRQEMGSARSTTLYDVTGDGVPELISLSAATGKLKVSIYTANNGTAKALLLNASFFSQKKPKSVTVQARRNSCVSITQSISGGKETIGLKYDGAKGTFIQVLKISQIKKSGKTLYSVNGAQVKKAKYTSAQKTFDATYKKLGALKVTAFSAKDKASTIKTKFAQMTKAYTSFSKVKSVSLNKTSLSLEAGKSYTLKAKRSPSTAIGDAISFSSSDPTVATVDANGKVVAVSGGKVAITATAQSGAKRSCGVTVKAPAATGVKLSKDVLSLEKGKRTSLTGTVSPATANQKLAYTTSDSKVASVASDGSVVALSAGKATITAKTVNGKKAECVVLVTDGPVVVVDISQHNYSSTMDWKKISQSVDLLILRCGVTRTDTDPIGVGIDARFAYYAGQCRAYGIPFGVYYYGKCSDEETAVLEAKTTWSIASPYDPLFYIYDAEESRLTKSLIETYMKTLKSLGAKKTGYYIAHHLYSAYKLDTSLVDFVWIPHYGKNTGEIESTPSYACDLHQYTSAGKIDGFPGRVDVSRLMGSKSLDWFLSR